MIRFPAVKRAPANQASVSPMLVGMGDVGALGCTGLPLQGAGVVRIVEGYSDDPARWLACAQAARQAGYRVALAVQYNNLWSIAQDQARFGQIVNVYAPYVWAVSIGNEQELNIDGPPQTGERYSQTWRALEPILAHIAPRAIRVAGEISPWGLAFLKDAVRAGLPGAQAFSAHPYPVANALNPGAFARLAVAQHVASWATEGMCGPGSWVLGGCQPESALHRAGFSLGLVWYATTGSAAGGPIYGNVA